MRSGLLFNNDFMEDNEQPAAHSIQADHAEFKLAESERFSARLGRMYAALSASNEAILRAKTREELFQWVCDSAVHGAKFSNSSIFVPIPETKWVSVAARTGVTADMLTSIRISVDENLAEGRGTVGTAFRTQKPCVTNDFQNDPRLKPWYETAREAGWNSAGVFPIIQKGTCAALIGFNSFDKDVFDDEMVNLLQRVADNVAFALDNFAREEERFMAEHKLLESEERFRKLTEERLRESEERFRNLTELSSDWYWEQDTEFRFTRLEGRQLEHSEATAATKYMGMTRWEAGFEMAGGWDEHRMLLQQHRPFQNAVIYRTLPDGSRSYIEVSGAPRFGVDGEFVGYRGVGRDITAQKVAEERIRYLATHDGLTGLPNRFMFSEFLNNAIQLARRYQQTFAVMFIDLDRFKIINDTLGHEAGDLLLKEIASRLALDMRTSDVVARLGGDEFVILVRQVSDQDQVTSVARKVLASVMRPVTLAGQECRVTTSIGICMYPGDAQDEQALMKNADMAMYRAKEQGKNNFEFYSDTANTVSLERLALESSLRQALERDEFFLVYQPKLDLRTGKINGVEALLRWQHPQLGVVMPAEFIPLAEETGLIISIGRWVLQASCKQAMAWQRESLPPVRVAVNLSARQFATQGLMNDIATAIKEAGIAPELLELEITEGMAMQNIDNATQVLAQMNQIGVRIAIDDFGTGYSSLAQIKRFPIDTLKIDRSFIRDLTSNPEDQAITKAIIAMGKTLSLTVVAEGVESREQEEFLRLHGCDETQGYYFSRPISADAFAMFLRAHLAA
jgi:diguanylate cyclase (GGDEF)-like protein/PAS domain S-box-containing protein